jgi:hypothetical protein
MLLPAALNVNELQSLSQGLKSTSSAGGVQPTSERLPRRA